MHRIRRMGAVGAGLLALGWATSAGIGPARATTTTVSADALIEQVRRGEAVDVADVDVQGDFDLRALHEVPRPFHCRRCRFGGAVRLDDVVLHARMDLSGSTFSGPFDAEGAVFEGAAQFGASGDVRSQFGPETNFAGAAFMDVGDFSTAAFNGPAAFTSARFAADARFDGAAFKGRVAFVDALFEGRASFGAVSPRACFDDSADFTRVRFSAGSDFRQRCFRGIANFTDAEFVGVLEMRQATFDGAALFADARIVGGATFLGATFDCRVTFDAVTASGPLDFTGAAFPHVVSFFRLASSDRLVLDHAIFGDGALTPCPGDDATRVQTRVVVTGMSVRRLSMDLRDVHRVGAGEERRILRTIEDGARRDGDIDAANKARYQRQVIEGDSATPIRRALDWAFYRWGAGYFLRPLRPAAVLAVLVLAIALYRQLRAPRTSMGWANAYFHQIERGMSLAFRKTARKDGEEEAPVSRWVEYGLYKLLVIAIALGVANSNETLRQMLDAIK